MKETNKEKKEFRKLTEEELKEVTGGSYQAAAIRSAKPSLGPCVMDEEGRQVCYCAALNRVIFDQSEECPE